MDDTDLHFYLQILWKFIFSVCRRDDRMTPTFISTSEFWKKNWFSQFKGEIIGWLRPLFLLLNSRKNLFHQFRGEIIGWLQPFSFNTLFHKIFPCWQNSLNFFENLEVGIMVGVILLSLLFTYYVYIHILYI